MSLKDDIAALRSLTNHASTNVWAGETHFVSKECVTRVLDALEIMVSELRQLAKGPDVRSNESTAFYVSTRILEIISGVTDD